MAKTREREPSVSLDIEDATKGIGIGPGPVKISAAQYDTVKFGKDSRIATCVTYERGGEDMPEENYTVGNGWKVSVDKQSLIPLASQSGLQENCNFMMLLKSLRECGMPKGSVRHPEDLVGIEGTLISLELDPIIDKKTGQAGKKRNVMVFEEITAAPWMEGGAAKAAPKAKAKGKTAPAPAAEEDDDDEEAPASAPAKKAKAAPAPESDEDDEDEAAGDDDTEWDDAAGEALIEALEEGPIAFADIDAKVRLQVKGHKGGKPAEKAIAARAADAAFYKQQLGWKVKKGTVTL